MQNFLEKVLYYSSFLYICSNFMGTKRYIYRKQVIFGVIEIIFKWQILAKFE